MPKKTRKQKLPPRGTGLIMGTARPRSGRGRPLTDVERRIRHTKIYGQIKSKPIRNQILKMFPQLCKLPLVMKVMQGML